MKKEDDEGEDGEGGENGGQLLAVGTPEEIAKNKNSLTGFYLKDKL